jgi:hypothetical protein
MKRLLFAAGVAIELPSLTILQLRMARARTYIFLGDKFVEFVGGKREEFVERLQSVGVGTEDIAHMEQSFLGTERRVQDALAPWREELQVDRHAWEALKQFVLRA